MRVFYGATPLPPVEVRVISFAIDAGLDGLPDLWAQGYGVTGSTNDPDQDGLSNIHEWLCGTSPVASNEYLKILSFDGEEMAWPARPYDAYEIQLLDGPGGSVTGGVPVVPTTNPGTACIERVAPSGFYRIERVP